MESISVFPGYRDLTYGTSITAVSRPLLDVNKSRPDSLSFHKYIQSRSSTHLGCQLRRDTYSLLTLSRQGRGVADTSPHWNMEAYHDRLDQSYAPRSSMEKKNNFSNFDQCRRIIDSSVPRVVFVWRNSIVSQLPALPPD
jgi:hypothetical protein